MATIPTDLITPVKKVFDGTGPVIYSGLTKKEWIGGVILNGVLRDRDNISGLSNSQIVTLAVVRANALIAALGTTGSDLVDPPAELRMGNSPQIGLSKKEYMAAHLISGFQGDNINIDALDPAPTAPTDNLAGLGAGLVEHITVPTAPTAALAATPIAGNINLITVPAAPTAALAGVGVGSVDHITVPAAPTMAMSGSTPGDIDHITVPAAAPTVALAGLGVGSVDMLAVPTAPTAVLAGVAGSVDDITPPIAPTMAMGGATPGDVDHITVPIAPTQAMGGSTPGDVDHITLPIAPTMVEGAAGAVDVGDHYYVITYQTADGETTMGAVSAVITIAAAAKHVTVTIPVSPFVGVTGRQIWRSKIAGGHVARTDFFLVGTVANNTDVSYDDNLAEIGMPVTNPPAANTAAAYEYCVTYTTADGETTMGAVSAATSVVADKTVDGRITVTIPVSPFVGVTGRNLYRCKAGTASTSSTRLHYFLAATIANNVDVTVVDDLAEIGLGASPPAANTAAKYEYVVTYVTADGETTMGAVSAGSVTVADKAVDGRVTVTIPVSTYVGVTGRNVYRCKAGTVSTSSTRTHYFLVCTVANNTDVTVVDNIAESVVGANPPAANDAAGYKYVAIYTTADGGECLMGAIQAAKVTVADKSADGQVTVTIPVSAEPGVTGRKVYRCKAGTAASSTLRTHFFLIAIVANNVDVAVTDNIAEVLVGVNPPAANTAGGHKYVVTYKTADGETTMSAISAQILVVDNTANGQVALTVIPTSAFVGVTDRNIYRSKAGTVPTLRTHFFLVGTLAGNVATIYTDNVADSMLGGNPPAANDAAKYEYCVTYVTADGETTMGTVSAGSVTVADKAVDGRVTVTIPVSPFVGVTARRVYRCKAGTVASSSTQLHYFLVGTVADNTTLTFVDNIAESVVGANPLAASTAAGYKYLVTYVGGDGTETTMGAIQAAKVTMADNAANGKITVTIPVSTELGVGSRNVYRCKAGMTTTATLRTHFFLVGTVADNSTATFTDNVAEAFVGAIPPAANGTGGHKYVVTYLTADGETTMGSISAVVTVAAPSTNGQVELSGIPCSSQPGVTSRKVYRSVAGALPTLRTHFFLVANLANNTATTYTDNTADSELPVTTPPATNTAGSYTYKVTTTSASGESNASSASGGVVVNDKTADGKVALTAIPTGPVGTLSRKIYRTKCGYGSVGPWYYHSAIALNVITIATDNTPDSGLDTATAPSTETAWEGLLAVDVVAKKDALVAALASTETEPVYPFGKVVSVAGSESIAGVTKQEHFASIIEAGYISDSANITAIGDDAALAAQANTLATAFVVALNA